MLSALRKIVFKCRVRQIHVPCPVRQNSAVSETFHELCQNTYCPTKNCRTRASQFYTILFLVCWNPGNWRRIQIIRRLSWTAGALLRTCACQFRFHDDRVAYHISIRTAYENGDADFGGNLLTYRIMQYIKLRLVERFGFILPVSVDALLQDLDTDASATAGIIQCV